MRSPGPLCLSLLGGLVLSMGAPAPSAAAPAEETATPAAPAGEPAPAGLRSGEVPSAPPAAPRSARLEQAKRSFDEGLSFFQQGRFGSARAALEEAYRLSQEPDLLFNLAQVAVELDRPQDAVSYFRRYLKARPTAQDRAEVQAQIGRLDDRIQREQRALLPRPTAARAPAPPPPRPMPRGAIGLLTGGGAVLLTGIALGVSAAALGTTVNSGERFDAGLDRTARALQPAGIALDVIGGVTAAAGAAWLGVWARGREPRRTQVAFSPFFAGLAVSGRY